MKSEEGNYNKPARGAKLNYSRHRIIKPTQPSCTVSMDINEEFLLIKTLLKSPIEVYNLTGKQELLVRQTESIYQQPTPEIDDDSNQSIEVRCLELDKLANFRQAEKLSLKKPAPTTIREVYYSKVTR